MRVPGIWRAVASEHLRDLSRRRPFDHGSASEVRHTDRPDYVPGLRIRNCSEPRSRALVPTVEFRLGTGRVSEFTDPRKYAVEVLVGAPRQSSVSMQLVGVAAKF